MKNIVVCSDSFGDYDYNLFDSKKYSERWKLTKEYENNKTMPAIPSYDCWPVLLNKVLNKNIVNLSVKGYGNLAICKQTQDYVIQNYKDIDFCIVGLTRWDRVEDSLLNRMGKKGAGSSYVYSKGLVKSSNLNGTYYYSDYKNPEREYFLEEFNYKKKSMLVYSTLRSIYELQKTCEEYNIKCIFISLLNPLPSNPAEGFNLITIHKILNTIIRNPYFNLINTQYCIGWPFISLLGGFNIFDKYFRNKPSYLIGETYQIDDKYKVKKMWDSHPNQKGHNLICEKIINELNNLGVIDS